jgi:enamine deaminase RidA (YjgF/YER057c/UK114 family)
MTVFPARDRFQRPQPTTSGEDMSDMERFGSGGPYEDLIGYSRVVRAGGLFVTAGCTSVVGGELVHAGDPYLQTVTAFGVGIDALAAAGCPREAIVGTRMYVTDRSHADEVGRAHHDTFSDVRPTTAMIIVAGFLDARMLVEVELTGWVSRC